MKPTRHPLRLMTLWAITSAAVVVVAPWFGTVTIDAPTAWREWWSLPAGEWSADTRVLALRLPRVVLAWLAGGALASAGAVIQTVLRNGLATPYTLGVASAGSFGAFLVLAFPSLALFGGQTAVLFSLSAALASLGLVLAISRRSRRADGLLLAGITLNFLFGAGVMLVRYLADPFRLAAMERWMLGSLDAVRFSAALAPAPWVALGFALCLGQARALDQLAFDPDLAAARGVSVERCRRLSLLGAGLLTAGVVAWTGPIGFVGLLVPHAIRPWTGLHHRTLLPTTFLAGGALLVLADLMARSLQVGGRHSEMPVGILTALIGGPLFLALLLRRQP